MFDYIKNLRRLMAEAEADDASASADTAAEGEGNAEPDTSTDEDSGESDASDGETDDENASYADFEMPDGLELDTSLADAFSPKMKELGLDQEQAQGLATTMAEWVQANNQSQQDAYSQQLTDWRTEAENDKEYGGDNYEKSVKIANLAITAYGGEALKQALDDTGMGNHPELIRAFVNAGKLIQEDEESGGSPPSNESNRVDRMYPTDK